MKKVKAINIFCFKTLITKDETNYDSFIPLIMTVTIHILILLVLLACNCLVTHPHFPVLPFKVVKEAMKLRNLTRQQFENYLGPDFPERYDYGYLCMIEDHDIGSYRIFVRRSFCIRSYFSFFFQKIQHSLVDLC
jgi:hypothetical protein